MGLSYSAYAIATLAYHVPCISRLVCDMHLDNRLLSTASLSVYET